MPRRRFVEVYHQKVDEELDELRSLIVAIETGNSLCPNLSEDNVYVSILKCLNNANYGMKYKHILRKILPDDENAERDKSIRRSSPNERIAWKLRKLRMEGLIEYSDKRYSLTRKGKSVCKYLFKTN
jgi:hypothetical protein